MDIELIKKQIYWEFASIVEAYERGEKPNLSHIKYEVETLIHGAESCKEMIDNRKKISDKDFYEMLTEFADIDDWNDYDCYRVIEIACNTKFDGEVTLTTTMQHSVSKREGHGRDFSWWDEAVGVNLKVLYTKDFKFDYEHVYTVSEIKKLIDEKKILVICEEERSLDYEENDYQKEEYQSFDSVYDEYSMEYEFFNEDGKFFPYTLKYIKKQVKNKKLKKLFSKHLEHVNNVINNTTSKSCCNKTTPYNLATEECAKEFEQSGYTKRLKKLNKINK